MAKISLVDGHSVGYTQHCGMRPLTHDGMEVQAIFGFIRFLKRARIANPDFVPIVLWDGVAQWRYDLHPDYKGDREKTPEQIARRKAYRAQIPYIQQFFEALGIPQAVHPGAEADDLAAKFSKNLSRGGSLVRLISSDQDWLQLIDENVSWQEARASKQEGEDYRKVTAENFVEFTGYTTPQAFADGIALVGDVSDSIPGVGGIGEKGAPQFLIEHGRVGEFFRKVDCGEYSPKKKAHVHLATEEGRAKFELNSKLVDLSRIPDIRSDEIVLTTGRHSPKDFQELCRQFNFKSLEMDREILKLFSDVGAIPVVPMFC